MNTDELRSQINKNLREMMKHEIASTTAENRICCAFQRYAKARKMPLDGAKKRIKDAIHDFRKDVNPREPGEAIHDAIDHIMNG